MGIKKFYKAISDVSGYECFRVWSYDLSLKKGYIDFVDKKMEHHVLNHDETDKVVETLFN